MKRLRPDVEALRQEFREQMVGQFEVSNLEGVAATSGIVGGRQIHFVEAKVDQNVAKWGSGVKAQIPARRSEAESINAVTKRVEERP